MRWLYGITNSVEEFELVEIQKDKETWHAAIHGVTNSEI